MSNLYVLYNPISGSRKGLELAAKLDLEKFKKNNQIMDITKINDYENFFNELKEDDEIIICGGDGTLNKFINNIRNIEIKNKIYYYATGTGNDFLREISSLDQKEPIEINKYLDNLPIVVVNGKEYKFLNGVGYGIDGYCCEVGDKLRETSSKPVNYTLIAIKGLLFSYKPTNATIIVDGKEYNFSKVWLAPTMKGLYYGGGMMPCPEQERFGDELSVLVFHNSSKFRTLTIFPSIFKGEHIKHSKYVQVLRGKEITVKFNEPRAIQIDGETILNIKEYTAKIN